MSQVCRESETFERAAGYSLLGAGTCVRGGRALVAGAIHARPGEQLSLSARHARPHPFCGVRMVCALAAGAAACAAIARDVCPISIRCGRRRGRTRHKCGRCSSASGRTASTSRWSTSRLDGKDHRSLFWQMFQHVINHGTYHRGQVTMMLRQLGAPPVGTDLIQFYWSLEQQV